MQVSAKTNDNIEKMFREIGLQLIAADTTFGSNQPTGVTIDPAGGKKKRKGKCCGKS